MKQGNDHEMAMGKDMKMSKSPYRMFALNLGLSAVFMYFVMYTMIDRTAELYNNLNNVYMTAMMVMSMAIVMLLLMPAMFPNKRFNLILYAAFAIAFVVAFAGMRTQALVGDRQFLRAMIPHHSGAVLMCQRSTIRDPEIVALCDEIVSGQKREIAQMKAILARK